MPPSNCSSSSSSSSSSDSESIDPAAAAAGAAGKPRRQEEKAAIRVERADQPKKTSGDPPRKDPPLSAGVRGASATASAPSAGSRGASASSVTYGSGVERYSGLKITDRTVRPEKWDTLMREKRYIPFDRLSSIEHGEHDAKDAVMIGVVYEKSLPKNSANGNRYVQWNLTDFSFPKPLLLSLFLFGDAFEAWEQAAEKPIANGAIVALLNPTKMQDRNNENRKPDEQSRASAKVSFGTQLVQLGTSPSLGYCSCTKKDGIRCSMPCDTDRGPLICFYHTSQKAAQQVKKWHNKGIMAVTRSGGLQAPPPAPSSDIFVLPAATPKASNSKQATSTTPQPPLKESTRPLHSNAAPTSSLDAATKRLLAGTGGANLRQNKMPSNAGRTGKGSKPASSGQAAGVPAAAPRTGSQPSATPSKPTGPSEHSAPRSGPGAAAGAPVRVALNSPGGTAQSSVTGQNARAGNDASASLVGGKKGAFIAAIRNGRLAAAAATSKAEEETARATRRLLMHFGPGGIPEVDPNQPLQGAHMDQQLKRNLGAVGDKVADRLGKCKGDKDLNLATAARLLSKSAPAGKEAAVGMQSKRRELTVARPVAAPDGEMIVAAQAGRARRSPGSSDLFKAATSTNGSAMNDKSAQKRKLEKEFGARIALQLTEMDPRKDWVRKQTSRFQSAVEQERAAKRHRVLSELEAQDCAVEKMEAQMFIAVSAWKCRTCLTTTDSDRTKAQCQSQGHQLVLCQVQKTRWECRSCKWSLSVLDRDLPPHCHRCNAMEWHQVPLQKAKRAPMERDFLLARGEELPFLGSFGSVVRGGGAGPAWRPMQSRAEQDDYAGLGFTA
eukprot:gnl/TRDRNA2_/TRDRNA2_45257_c0_seq1.p1 gnl/TRDRNA2_/TRDRNA2_45257_c0~~gnl/TRDRNA2_/TRDRNA2_45257_c0_seq1.p1  ORF type:complete len:836 (+),score=136.94 gnl/TRDRNA2_/TRDRNA2_45257_c0_seq1:120-2627(+)